ncbi:hypothetical protein [Ralstonia pseudosolanacearum]
MLLPASDAASFLFRVSLAGYDFAQVAVKRVPQGCLLGFGPIDVDADSDVGFRSFGPLPGLLPCVERAVDGLVSALANFGAPIGAALVDVCHSGDPMRKVDVSLGQILRSGKIPAKGTVSALRPLARDEKKAPAISRKCLIFYCKFGGGA